MRLTTKGQITPLLRYLILLFMETTGRKSWDYFLNAKDPLFYLEQLFGKGFVAAGASVQHSWAGGRYSPWQKKPCDSHSALSTLWTGIGRWTKCRAGHSCQSKVKLV